MTATADEAIGYVNRMNALSPDTPFFIKFAPGATHAPHHPTAEWVKKISDMHLFDPGWNKLRETIFEKPEAARCHPAERETDALAERSDQGMGSAHG